MGDAPDPLEPLRSRGWVAPEPGPDGVRYFGGTDRASISYPDEGLELLGGEAASGYWFDHRAAAVRRHLEQLGVSSLWEVGAGTGTMAHRLRDSITEVVVVEPLPAGARAAAALGLPALCGTLADLRLPDRSLDAVGAFDVLEHLDDPGTLTGEMFRVLRPGGIVIVTVPALPALWGDEDDAAGHRRRYRRATLGAGFTGRGFRRVRTEYLYASLVPPAAALRALPYRLGRRTPPGAVLRRQRAQLAVPPAVDRMVRAVLAAEAAAARIVPLPFGLSLLGVFAKP